MARRYFVTTLPEPGVHALPRSVAHHATSVSRLRAGDPIVLFDGSGTEAVGHIRAVNRGATEIEVDAWRVGGREPRVELTVAFAVPRANRAERLFEQGTELGVRRFVPLLTRRSRPGGDSAAKLERWLRVVRAAAGQCDRATVPAITDPEALEDWVERDDIPTERYFATVDAAPLGPARDTRVALAVGPEGGWERDEIELLAARRFAPASLGALTLRTETAVLAGAARLLVD